MSLVEEKKHTPFDYRLLCRNEPQCRTIVRHFYTSKSVPKIEVGKSRRLLPCYLGYLRTSSKFVGLSISGNEEEPTSLLTAFDIDYDCPYFMVLWTIVNHPSLYISYPALGISHQGADMALDIADYLQLESDCEYKFCQWYLLVRPLSHERFDMAYKDTGEMKLDTNFRWRLVSPSREEFLDISNFNMFLSSTGDLPDVSFEIDTSSRVANLKSVITIYRGALAYMSKLWSLHLDHIFPFPYETNLSPYEIIRKLYSTEEGTVTDLFKK